MSTAPLSALLRVHVPPINVVVYHGPYSLEGMGGLILRWASRLDAFSGYPSQAWLSSGALGRTTATPEACSSRSSRTRDDSSQTSNAHGREGPNCLTTFRTQLACRFKGRTAHPLGPASAPGCDEPTSRCQTLPSMWTLGEDKPVIPGVRVIR